MVKSMAQLFVIGGTYTNTDACDLAANIWAQHDDREIALVETISESQWCG
jgi:hypothetical protein